MWHECKREISEGNKRDRGGEKGKAMVVNMIKIPYMYMWK
jgi:hypothetical protein